MGGRRIRLGRAGYGGPQFATIGVPGELDFGERTVFWELYGSYGDNQTLTLGFNNVFDEDPPLCFPCSVIGMSQVVHDLPGRLGYLRMAFRR